MCKVKSVHRSDKPTELLPNPAGLLSSVECFGIFEHIVWIFMVHFTVLVLTDHTDPNQHSFFLQKL